MKLEFLDDISDNGKYPWADPDKLIRLYDFGHSEANRLIEIIQTRIIGNRTPVDLSKIDFIQPLNCNLRFELSPINHGIDPDPDHNFTAYFTVEGYQTMICYMSAFIGEEHDLAGYNWLYDPSINKIDLLFSPGGTW